VVGVLFGIGCGSGRKSGRVEFYQLVWQACQLNLAFDSL
jgi:hypothetical protein